MDFEVFSLPAKVFSTKIDGQTCLHWFSTVTKQSSYNEWRVKNLRREFRHISFADRQCPEIKQLWHTLPGSGCFNSAHLDDAITISGM